MASCEWRVANQGATPENRDLFDSPAKSVLCCEDWVFLLGETTAIIGRWIETIRIGAEQFRRELADLLARVAHGGEQVIVERHGTPQAVLISFKLFEQFAESIQQQGQRQPTEAALLERLIEKGIVRARDRTATALIKDDWDPVPTQGRPVSEIIIEERR